ncbi:hypothetical protein AB0M79_09265 [Polymorphospora sp. NPDC051019]|uniref:hypothetical protein n=1 Tax=Polymorphospora sp. NPDC051019 TaxID=3155725 RepID=UPI003414B3B1
MNDFEVENIVKSPSLYVVRIRAKSAAPDATPLTFSISAAGSSGAQVNGQSVKKSMGWDTANYRFPFALNGVTHKWEFKIRSSGTFSLKLTQVEIYCDKVLVHGDIVS